MTTTDPTLIPADIAATPASGPLRPELEGRRVLVVGLGESGLAIARWADFAGAVVTVADTRQAPPGLDALQAACPRVRFIGGPLDPAVLDGIELIGWSQGLSPLTGDAAGLHAQALQASIPVWGELEFFAREIARLRATGYQTRLVAITGTNGKTTTTRLVGHLCRQAGLSVAVAGNISPAALESLRLALEHQELPQVWVLELASYQLALSDSFVADSATLLNFTQDHLDWHLTLGHYLDAKQRIYAPPAVCVVNRDDPLTLPGASLTPVAVAQPATPQSGSKRRSAASQPSVPQRAIVSFGLDAPVTAPGFGVVRENGLSWLVEAVADEDSLGRRRREAPEVRVRRLMPADALLIRGSHNQANALAALALARAIDVPMAAMLHGLRSYAGEPHRCECIGQIDGVEYYDDSKGTNVGATVAALVGLDRPVILIAGGDGKGQDFSPLVAPVAAHAAAVLLIGRDGPAIRAALQGIAVPLEDCATLEAAVARAAALARPGQSVLLSPACASLDMFRNYGHRAQVFIDAVRGLALERGQAC
jgi:UDP-N-acetylmuramoylalanine--D-glutamate ligase